MTAVRVVVDSAAALPDDVVQRGGLDVVPLRLNIGSDSYADGEIPLDEVVAKLDLGVKTSAPSPGEWTAAFDSALAAADHALVLTVSAEMSSTYASARLAASSFPSRVRVIDTGTAAGAEGLVALAAARVASSGGSLDASIAAATRVMDRVRLDATITSLDQLVRSGRVPSVAGWAGRKVGVQPLFEFVRDEVHTLRPAFSRSAALERILHAVEGSAPAGPAQLHAAALHAVAPTVALHLEARLRDLDAGGEVFISSFSPVMVAHTGPGLAGVAWWWEDLDHAASG